MESRIVLENTNFIFETNLSGDPARDRFHSPGRKCNIIIPNPEMAQAMIADGFNVKATNPRPEEDPATFVPTFFVSANTNYECKYPPRIFLVAGDNPPALMSPETVGIIDTIRVANVDAVLNVRAWEKGKTLYVNTMYVVQDLASDPFAGKYVR